MRSSNEEIYLSMGISKTVYDYAPLRKSLRDRFDEVDSNGIQSVKGGKSHATASGK